VLAWPAGFSRLRLARVLRRRQQRPDQPEEGEKDPEDEHHPVPLPQRHDPEGDQQHYIEDSEAYPEQTGLLSVAFPSTLPPQSGATPIDGDEARRRAAPWARDQQRGAGIFRWEVSCGDIWGHTGSFPAYRTLGAAAEDGSSAIGMTVNATELPDQAEEAVLDAQALAACRALDEPAE
jgi:hypothetical protein